MLFIVKLPPDFIFSVNKCETIMRQCGILPTSTNHVCINE